MVKRYQALAGINGGFSQSTDPWATYHGDPSGFYVLNGKILSEPKEQRATFGILNQDGNQILFIDQPLLETVLSIYPDQSIKITGINRRRTNEDLILYTPEWGRSTITRPGGTEVVVQDGVVKEIHKQEGSHLIPPNGFILSASGKYADWVREHIAVNTKVEIKHTLTSRRSPVRHLPLENCNYTSAGPALIIDGEKVTDFSKEGRGFSGKFSERHPRTAIGISKDKMSLMFVVVDGRNPQVSVGMSLEELATFMADLGSFNAYNLDGGGSSTMVINEKVVNKFSDERERRSSDALLLFERVIK